MSALLQPVHDVDLFWQTRLGELAIDHRAPVRQELFYPDVEGRLIVPIYGLMQLWYAVTKRIGGWELIKSADERF